METEQYIALIIDDDSTATSELRKGLAAHPEFTVAGSATTATAGEQLLFRLRPDILFLDVELPDMQGVAFVLLHAQQVHTERIARVGFRLSAQAVRAGGTGRHNIPLQGKHQQTAAADRTAAATGQRAEKLLPCRHHNRLPHDTRGRNRLFRAQRAAQAMARASLVRRVAMPEARHLGRDHPRLFACIHTDKPVVHRQRQLPRHDLRQRVQALPSL